MIITGVNFTRNDNIWHDTSILQNISIALLF